MVYLGSFLKDTLCEKPRYNLNYVIPEKNYSSKIPKIVLSSGQPFQEWTCLLPIHQKAFDSYFS